MEQPQHQDAQQPQSVRFNSTLEEIKADPDDSIHMVNTITAREKQGNLTEDQKKDLKDLAVSLQQSQMQSARVNQFVFDPVSLPVSRVPSAGSTRSKPHDGRETPRSAALSRNNSSSHLTPTGSGSGSAKEDKLPISKAAQVAAAVPSSPQPDNGSRPGSRDTKPSAAAEARALARPKSMTEISGAIPVHPKQAPSGIELPKGDSIPPSQNTSPLGTPRGEGGSGTHSPYSRPFTPVGDPNDPYARSRRPPQARNLEAIDPRFVFTGQQSRPSSMIVGGARSPRASVADLPRADDKAKKLDDKKHHKHLHHQHHGSMSDLKRFFKFGGSKKDKDKDKDKDKVQRERSPAPSVKVRKEVKRSGYQTPPSYGSSSAVNAIPFADDHGLEAKYGKFERLLGAGAGGSVRLMKRGDGVTFAVKQFRERHAWETEKAYNKKITAEFCIGSTLHHGNVIEAMDIVNEKGRWYEVMEYAPYDLFAIVMTGKMSREEVACCFMQIVNGVAYLHSMGLAHRDMKLDNVVVNEHGIMKIIDFGSAHVFQYPFEAGTVMAEGVVGSDPYLAPEVFTQKTYDAQKVDVWSLAIIFCCMSLRRFPWKCPKQTDNSFKLFVTQPTEEELKHPLYPQRPQQTQQTQQSQQVPSDNGAPAHKHHHHHHSSTSTADVPSSSSTTTTNPPSSAASQISQPSTASSNVPPITLKGPWRLLRLLPRETRHIVGRMLELDPAKRASLGEVTEDPWVERTPFCKQEPGGTVVRAQGHTHVLEGGAASQGAAKEGENK